MAYDAALADRVRKALAGEKNVTEKAMFGGIAFLVGGHMAIGVATEDLMVRVGPEAHEASLARPHTRPMDFTGRPMRGYVFVAPAGARTPGEVRAWTARALAFARSLPSKTKAGPAARMKQAARRPR
jgi:TfoX/Sxy family transcriptional regulator of competence genes